MEISFISENDVIECNDFHNRAYNTKRTLLQWHWQFDKLLGDIRPFVVAIDGGRIVGTQALMPIMMCNGIGDFLTAKSEETLVDVSMRGKGLFQKMYQPLLSYAMSHEVKAIWGFTPASKAFEGVGFSVPARTAQLVCPLSVRASAVLSDSVAGRFKKTIGAAISVASIISSTRVAMASCSLNGVRLKVIDKSPEGAEAVCRDFVRSWGGQTILRNKAYLQWRYFDNPVVRATLLGAYRRDALVGWVTYSLDENSMGYIVDAIVARSDDVKHLLHALILEAVLALRAAGAIAIRSWHLNRHPFDQLFSEVARSLGFYLVRRGEPVVLYLAPNQAGTSSLDVWDDWFITRAYTQGDAG